MTRLAPPADLPQALTDLGGAQLLSGDLAAAVSTLNTALEAGPDARAFYYRARARELAGQTEASLADYNLAGRAAFASAQELSSGEAHLYRGILLYRRKDFIRAEDEFSSALNLDIPEALRPDASAWRHLSAVAAGFCASSRESLARSLSAVSPFFPKDEARTLAAGCATVQGKMASRSVNKVILLGHLGKDAETKFTPSGISVSKFSLATNRRTKDQQSGGMARKIDDRIDHNQHQETVEKVSRPAHVLMREHAIGDISAHGQQDRNVAEREMERDEETTAVQRPRNRNQHPRALPQPGGDQGHNRQPGGDLQVSRLARADPVGDDQRQRQANADGDRTPDERDHQRRVFLCARQLHSAALETGRPSAPEWLPVT
jgi:single-stranded DNA-binding protein